MTDKGWVKLHRKIIDWEWYDDLNVRVLFLHLLLRVNYEDKLWRGITIKRGSFITSLQKMASESKLSLRQVRVALNKLKMTGEVTIETTNEYSVITINNYEVYQQNDTPDDNPATNERHASDTPMTTTKERKEIKKERINTLGDDVSPRTAVRKEFGNEYINELISYLKTKSRLPALDDTQANNRKYGYLLLNKYKTKEDENYDNALTRSKMLIDFLSESPFWRPRVTSLQKFHKYSVSIYAQAEEHNAKKRISS